VDDAMIERFLRLGRYAAGAGVHGLRTAAILFTCSAFGPAIEAVQAALPIPVLKPNEAAFAQALATGPRIGVVVTFGPSLSPLTAELGAMAKARGVDVTIDGRIAGGAMELLRAGDGEAHDALVAEMVQTMSGLDAIVLGQFSMARAAPRARAVTAVPVLTTPESAVARLKETVS
jgi:Asp/Glu/hydantoin racemase